MRTISIELKWAFIFAAVSLLWMWLERSTGLHDERIAQHATFSMLFAIPAIAIYVLALLEKRRKRFHGHMNYKQGFFTGLVLTIFIALLTPITQYITATYISPGFFSNAAAHAVEQGMMSTTQAEAYFNLRSYIPQAFIGALIMGLLTSAIVGFFTRTRKNSIATAA